MRTSSALLVLVSSLSACQAGPPARLPHQLPPPATPHAPPAPVPAAALPTKAEVKPPEAPPVEPGQDILAEARAWQADPHPRPPASFRAGHVTPRALPVDALVPGDGRFELRLPSAAPVVTPTAYDGKLFVSGGFRSKEFYALEARTGKPVWGLALDDDGPSTAACADGVCAFNTESCTVFTVDAASGDLLWSAWLGDPLTSAPAIAQSRVFTSYPAPGHGAATHVLAAFELRTGKILWQRWIDSDVQSSPVVSGGKVFASTFGGALYTFDPADGTILSARRVRATSAPTVAAGGEVLYSQRAEAAGEAVAEGIAVLAPSGAARRISKKAAVYLDAQVQSGAKLAAAGKALDAGNGFAGGAPAGANPMAAQGNIGKASVSTMQAHQGSRVLPVAGNVVAAMGDEVVCSDPHGKTLWSYKAKGDLAAEGGALVTAPAAAGGSVFVGTLDGEVLRLDPASGSVQARWSVGAPVRSQPIMVDGWIYVGTENGRVVGIDTRTPEVTGWSTWGGDAARTGLAAAR